MSTVQNITAEIRSELRSVLRQHDDLAKPLDMFGEDTSRPQGEPRYYVMFDLNPRMPARGYQARTLMLSLPDERILDNVHSFAKSVWQLKDRLKLWVSAQRVTTDIEKIATSSPELLICADLANWKKHGENRNRSGRNPKVTSVEFDLSSSGRIELYYDGATKRQELLVERASPISYGAPIKSDNGTILGDAVEVIWRAFQTWVRVVNDLGLLNESDPESAYLRGRLMPTVTT